ncbi:MAG: radical SAM protein [Solirubrobacterales bacterium]
MFVRWDEQKVEAEKERPLPGLAVDAVRTFDAPEALGTRFHEVRAKSALNHVPGAPYGFEWTVNHYRGCAHACNFCFARRTHPYLGLDAGRDFEREIVVKVNVPEVLRAELGRRSWKRDLVAIGTNTDPYQWVEGRYELMPPTLEALRDADTPVSVLTKSPLALRDIDLYAEMAGRAGASVNMTEPTLDVKVWRATEPHTPNPGARLEAVAELNARRPADAGDKRRARAGRADRRDRPRRRRQLRRLRGAAPPRRGPRRLLRLAGGEATRPDPPLRGPLRPGRLPAAEGADSARGPGQGLGQAPPRGYARR